MDVFGLALIDFYEQRLDETLWLNTSYGEIEEMPTAVFFRDVAEMPELETYAMSLCKGSILDIGAGVGSHALLLQQNGFEVTAIEISETACDIMKKRGVKKFINASIFNYKSQKFDTLLLLMNGIGLSQTLSGLTDFLKHAAELLNAGGQLIFDSSDIEYLYEDVQKPDDKYYGEISYQYQYKSQKGNWFGWLYVDQNTLLEIADQQGWNCNILYEDDMDQYLVRLTRKIS